jgi:hypothetical protein
MPISERTVAELCDRCGLSAEECEAALTEHVGDVDEALRALIDAGRVKSDALNPNTVSLALFERAAWREKLECYRKFATQFPGKTPEQLMVEDDAKQAERIKGALAEEPERRGMRAMSRGEQARFRAQARRRSEWLEKHPFTLKLPPFPPLRRQMHEWTGEALLKAWAGTQARRGPYTSQSSDMPSNGSFAIRIPRLGEDDANPRPPSDEQVMAYRHFVEHQEDVTATAIKALLDVYIEMREHWLSQDPELDWPVIDSVQEMRKNVGLGILHVHGIAKEGCAYVGLELGCTWDEGHGAGVLIHCGRVVAIGLGETSFDANAAKKDGGKEIR